MPRRPRLDAPGLVHHVFVRGIDRRDLFLDDQDRRAALDALGRVLPEDGAGCFAWAVQANHLHLVVRTGHRPLARVMQRVGTSFGRDFNDRYGRSGYVFESRYGERPVADDAYLVTLIRYVHRNPIEAGSVPSMDALELLGSSPLSARTDLCALMERAGPAKPPSTPGALDARIDAVCRRPESIARRLIATRARTELGLRSAVISQAFGVSRQALWARLRGKS